jgi:isoquinoline 1-oxidoreductase beta subunit
MSRTMNTDRGLSRRSFLKISSAGAGGLMIGFYLPGKHLLAAQTTDARKAMNAFVHIGTDDIITLIIHKPENGQGTTTSLAQLLAEELEADWKKIRWEYAPVNPVYGGAMQGTFGSQAVRTTYTPLRQAGAAAREMLVQAAAQQWGVDKSQCRAENNTVINTLTNARLTYGSLADAASKFPAPAPNTLRLKTSDQFKVIGKSAKRLDTPLKTTGKATYALDVRLPGMLYAVVARCPVAKGSVASFDASAAKAVAGVKHVLQIPEGVAVVADNTWAAMEGRKALIVQWNEGENANLTSDAIRKRLSEMIDTAGNVATRRGQGDAALSTAAKQIEAEYEAPYLAHAPMEPFTCVADVKGDSCEVWVGSQIPGIANSNAMQASGLPADKIKLHTLYMGGGFGSRGGGAYVTEAVGISKATGSPVKLTYTREDDLQSDRYRPASLMRFKAGLDSEGKLSTLTARVSCSTFSGLQNGINREGVAGIADVLYGIPNVQIEYREPGVTIPTNYWRSVGHSQNTFFTESFIDELAIAAGKDPVEFRRELLANQPGNASRLLGVMNLAAERAEWGKPLPSGRGRGVAVVNCFGSFNAQIAEVSVSEGKIRVHRVVSAVDCGQVVNPAGVEQQMQSAIVYGLSAALRGQITFDKGRAQQTNFDKYEPLRINEMPVVETYIVPSTNNPGGMGEVGTPAIAPAVGNAIFKATGKRIRRMPFSLETFV